MRQYNKDIYLIDPLVLENLLRQPPINPSIFLEGIKSQSIKGSIVLTLEDLTKIVRAAWEESEWICDMNNGLDMSDIEADGPIAKDYKEFLSTYLKDKGITL